MNRAISTYDDGLHGRMDAPGTSLVERAITDLRIALRVSPILCGSLTLNFDASGVCQSVETRTHKKIA